MNTPEADRLELSNIHLIMSIVYADFQRQVAPLDLIGIHGNRLASYAIELAEFFGSGNGKCVRIMSPLQARLKIEMKPFYEM